MREAKRCQDPFQSLAPEAVKCRKLGSEMGPDTFLRGKFVAAEKATALVLRTTDWSESSRIATLWTREFGRVRVLAKGGRRLKSNFESALDLLTVCSIVLLRKSSGTLDLLTEAQVVRRFPHLRADLAALYAAYSEKKPLSTQSLLDALAQTVPLSTTRAEEIQTLREWARTRAVPATARDDGSVTT